MTRRLLIAAIILGSYGFYRLLQGHGDLSSLGIVSFVATVQFLPGALSVLYWQTANRKGFIAGLLCGLGLWFLSSAHAAGGRHQSAAHRRLQLSHQRQQLAPRRRGLADR